jgi:AraC-like DNA-binding protein
MRRSPLLAFIQHAAARDVYALAETDGLGLTYDQLESGRIAVKTATAHVAGAIFSDQAADRSFGFRGTVPDDVVHVRIWNRCQRIRANGSHHELPVAIVALPGAEIDVTVIGASRALGFTVRLDDLRTIGGANILPGNVRQGVVTVSERESDALGVLRRHGRLIFARSHPGEQSLVVHREIVRSVSAIVGGAASSAVDSPFAGNLRLALALIRETIAEPISMEHVRQACGWSKQSMIACFNEAIGISPAAYSRILRLNAVHRALMATNAIATEVHDVAAGFGFHHGSRFAVEYGQLFGVPPSQTLEASRAERAARRFLQMRIEAQNQRHAAAVLSGYEAP